MLPALGLLGAVAVAATVSNPLLVPLDVRRTVRAATVEVLPAGCTGVLAGTSRLVLTARHCVGAHDESLRVRGANGVESGATVVAIDDVADQVALLLDEPSPAVPLAVAGRAPITGTVLYFMGNPVRPRWQRVRVDRIAMCPSLPRLPNALFTNLHGSPGDSGAPLVDGAAQVVGLVHGGARCEIATPWDHLIALLERVYRRHTI